MDDDRRLLERFLAGSLEAFDGIVERHEGKLLRLAGRLCADGSLAQDAVQNTFVRLAEKARWVAGIESLESWLVQVCGRFCLDALRSESRRRRREREAAAREAAPSGELPAEREESRALLDAALDRLTDRQRQVVGLYYFEDLSYRDIALALGISIGNVGGTLSDAIERLGTSLAAVGGKVH